jgi:hypothetical protein
MQQKTIRSTKLDANVLALNVSLDISPSQEPSNERTHAVFATMLHAANLHKSYSDQTGEFPIQSS